MTVRRIMGVAPPEIQENGLEPEGLMGVEKKAEKMGAEAADAISGVATYAKEQVSDLASRSQGMARDADRKIAEHTGKSSDEWIGQVTRLITAHPWKAVAMTAVVLYLFGKLRA